MDIRYERADDLEKIKNINLEAFETDAEARLIDLLRDSDVELISLVAEDRNEIIGHIVFSPVTIEGISNIKLAGLGPMAVLPEWQNKGVGTLLVKDGLKECEKAGYAAVIVLGHPDYYPRFGFSPAINFGLKSEYDVPPEVFMVKELLKDALKDITGTVRYHKAFNEV